MRNKWKLKSPFIQPFQVEKILQSEQNQMNQRF